MKKIFLPLAIVSIISFASCGGDNAGTTENTATTENTDQICFYAFDSKATTSIKWTAFKTTAKVGVGGEFTDINVTGGDKSSKITDVLSTVKFSINTNSTNTGNEDRDSKIVKHFFGTMESTDLIIGQIYAAEGNNESGACNVFLTLNGIEKDITLDYELADNVITLSGEINVLEWNANSSLEALNEVCKDLHKGADGKSVTWPNVELSITTTLKKDCH